MSPALRLIDGSTPASPVSGPARTPPPADPARPIGRLEPALKDPAKIERLRDAVRRIEGGPPGWADADGVSPASLLPLGVPAIDDHLPWGALPKSALHEIAATEVEAAGTASALCALLAARAMEDSAMEKAGAATVLWCEGSRTLDAGALHPPGLRRFGLDPARLVLARTKTDAETLWAMEDGLRCSGLAAVIGVISDASLTETRRLQLAAEASGVPALMVRPCGAGAAPSAALTRWRIGPASSESPADAQTLSISTSSASTMRWRLSLFRCRGGMPGNWDVEWHDETRDLTLAAPLRDRPNHPVRAAG